MGQRISQKGIQSNVSKIMVKEFLALPETEVWITIHTQKYLNKS